ncbi:MAG: hypothetical protein FWC20_06380 [Oscillospiraceae bacterium]|nr:hypothetical protein [Oscillospiraceae bacterium]
MLSRLKTVLKNESGVSLLFVLGVLMMLLAAGAAVLAAAMGNVGINVRQERHNRAMLLTDSIHRNIQYSLSKTGVPTDEFESSLSGQIALLIYESSCDCAVPCACVDCICMSGVMEDIMLSVDIAEIAYDLPDEILLSFPYASVTITPFVPEMPELSIDERPRTALLSATMVVEFTLYVDAGTDGNRIITSRAVYMYSGGVLVWFPDSLGDLDLDERNFSEQGVWEMVSFEIIESEVY